MNIEEIREYCLSKPGATESFPFNETTLVFKVMGKMFCLANLDGELGLSLKNKPEKVVEMREMYPSVGPGPHMSNIHWNLVMVDYTVTPVQLMTWIDESYNCVVEGLTRKLKEELKKLTHHDSI